MHRVFARLARCVPHGQGCRQDLLAHVHGGGELGKRVALAQDATFKLAQRFFAPCEFEAPIVEGGRDNGIGAAS